MRNRLLGTAMAIMGTLLLGVNMGESSFQRIDQGLYETEITAIATDPNRSTILLGTTGTVYRAKNPPTNFQRIIFPAAKARVNQIHFNPQNFSHVLVATDRGLFESPDDGVSWRVIFHPMDELGQNCQAVLIDGMKIYVATLDGLFIKDRNVPLWRKFPVLKVNQPVFYLTDDSRYIFVGTDRDVWRISKGDGTSREIYSLPGGEPGAEGELFNDESSRKNFESKIRALKYSASQNALYLVSNKGVFVSRTSGDSWEEIPAFTVPEESVKAIEVMEDGRILLGTSRGMFVGQTGDWDHFSTGLGDVSVHDMVLGDDGNVYVASDRGLFVMTVGKTVTRTKGRTSMPDAQTGKIGVPNFSNEPAIARVQAMAVEYAEVHPNKIKEWRRRANLKAILPTLSVGLDRSASNLYHWDTGGTPDYLQKGKDFLEWDVSLSWDLGDLIWSNDQTSIDSRSKLMVELRQDILDEVTRLYFERRRLQVQLSRDTQVIEPSRMEQELRVAELTALIDGLTGGGFSHAMEQ